jgi:hypothetical protein
MNLEPTEKWGDGEIKISTGRIVEERLYEALFKTPHILTDYFEGIFKA